MTRCSQQSEAAKSRYALLELSAVFCTLSVVYLSGFGVRLLAEGAGALLLGGICLLAWRRSPFQGCIAVALALLGFLAPEYTKLDGFWLFAVALAGISPLLLVPASHSLLELTPAPAWLLSCLPVAIGAVACLCRNRFASRAVVYASGVAVLTSLAAVWPQAGYHFAPQQQLAAAYRITELPPRLFSEKFGGKRRIHGAYRAAGNVQPANGDLLVGEHDLWNRGGSLGANFAEDNYRQPIPWHANEFVGNQYWRFAVRKDRALISNLGGRLKPEGRVLLADPRESFVEPTLLASLRSGVTVLADSDYWVARLANHQRSLLGVILGSWQELWRPFISNAFFVIGAVAASFRSRVAALGLLGIIVSLASVTKVRGELRLAASLGDPHDPVRVWGVPRQLADLGMPIVVGNEKTQVLIVEAGRSARKQDGERLVVLEPGAQVTIANKTIRADSLPLGDLAGISDARTIIVDGQHTIAATTEIDGTKIIATGSPALLPLEIWQQYLQQ